MTPSRNPPSAVWKHRKQRAIGTTSKPHPFDIREPPYRMASEKISARTMFCSVEAR
jgi:hypothetical protein